MVNHIDYYDAGFRVFGIYGVQEGICECGNPKCEALFKHPRVSNWQNTPYWGEDQFEAMYTYGQFDTGFGVLCDGYLIIDIDPRNGGSESYTQLVEDTGIDYKTHAAFVVATGGGGWHIYYMGTGDRLESHLKKYPGIDFKSSGFVVGSGSMHASGTCYESEKGNPDDITEIPEQLLSILKKKQSTKSKFEPIEDEVTLDEIVSLLEYVKNDDLDYEEWIEIGMIIHESLSDDGYEVWLDWSANSSKHNPEQMEMKWHSFGKNNNRVTIGTLIQKAESNGYQPSVTFEPTVMVNHDVAISSIDLNNPPGLVGECVNYINSCSRFPRERLAVSAALSAVSSIGGMRFEDEEYGVTPNLFTFNVAGSATGKEAIQQAHGELLIAAGMGQSVYGTIKSEQEIYRNATRHQSINYLIDEIGIMLNKIEQGSKGSSSVYMGGIIGALMSIYSKANGKLPLGADTVEDLKARLNKRVAEINKLEENNESNSFFEKEKESLEEIIRQITNGYIEKPFLSLSGYTTPVTFNNIVNYNQATNGFIGRSIIFEEKNNNPKAKKRFKKGKLPSSLEMQLKQLRCGGNFDVTDSSRIEFNGATQMIHTSDDAIDLLDSIEESLHEKANEAMDANGLEAVVRRSFELVLKVSMILAIGDGMVRTVEHVEWAYALVSKDLENKINLTRANMAEEEKNLADEVLTKVQHKLDKREFQTIGSIHNKMRKISRENIQKAIDHLIQTGIAVSEEHKPKRGPTTYRYYLK